MWFFTCESAGKKTLLFEYCTAHAYSYVTSYKSLSVTGSLLPVTTLAALKSRFFVQITNEAASEYRA